MLLLTALSACVSNVRTASLDRNSPSVEAVRTGVGSRRATTPAPDLNLSAKRYRSHIALLADDELGGRGTGSNGIDLAAGYIAGEFAAAGLKPGGPGGTYFQPFRFDRGIKITDKTQLTIDGCDVEVTVRQDFRPFGFSAQGDFAGDVVFVGYGVIAPKVNYDDYKGIDVSGKVVLMLRREPPDLGADDEINHANFDTKVKTAADHGAVAVLIVNQDPGDDEEDRLVRFRSRGDDYGLPAIHLKRNVADKMLAAGGLESLSRLQRRLDDKTGGASAPLAGVRVGGTIEFKANTVNARNVIGVLPGNGPHADEYVVIGGHYDHLGTRRGRVYNGADDNASGTAGVIELAWALSGTPRRDRSVLLMTFSGEEMGLRGSRHFVEKPTVDLDKIVAMINMDMIGRLTPDDDANKLAIQGLGTGDSFHNIVEKRAGELGMTYLPDESAKGPSDHASFYEKGIPSLFFFTGIHEDYHQPGDDVDKINADGAVRIVGLVYRIAMDLINGEGTPQFAEVDQPANIFRGATRSRAGVVMGIMPDMEDESNAPGWRVARVFPGTGADAAGMKSGDRILSVAGHTIHDFSDYREATRDKKPGDLVDVVVTRGHKELTLKVELRARGG